MLSEIGSGRFTRASGKVGVNENDSTRRSRGTDGSNPVPSSGESANHRFRDRLPFSAVIADDVDANGWVLLIDPAAAAAGDPH